MVPVMNAGGFCSLLQTSPGTPGHQPRLPECLWLELDLAHVLRLQWDPEDKPQLAIAPQRPTYSPCSIGSQCSASGIRPYHGAPPLPGAGARRVGCDSQDRRAEGDFQGINSCQKDMDNVTRNNKIKLRICEENDATTNLVLTGR